jgi:acyl carrier protein
VLDEVKGILRDTLQLGDRVAAFDLETRLLGSLPELDSMAVVSVITAIEERFGIAVDDDDISAETFETIGSLCRYVEERMAAG